MKTVGGTVGGWVLFEQIIIEFSVRSYGLEFDNSRHDRAKLSKLIWKLPD
jgi:hypothetical protein